MSNLEEATKHQSKALKAIRKAMEQLDAHAQELVAKWVAETWGKQGGGKP